MTIARSVPTLVLRTDVSAIPLGVGNVPGWVSGSPANLAASTNVFCVFDLGPNWDQYKIITVSVDGGTPQAGAGIQAHGSDDGITNKCRLGTVTAASMNASWYFDMTSSTAVVGVLRPSGRFVRVLFANGAPAAQGASAAVQLTAFAD